MGQEDHLKKQIDQLARALAKMLFKLLNMPASASVNVEIQEVSKVFKKEIDLDLSSLLAIPDQEFIFRLRSEKKLEDHHLETIADIFSQLAYHQGLEDFDLKKKLLERILMISEDLNANSATYSLDRQYKCNAIRKLLKEM